MVRFSSGIPADGLCGFSFLNRLIRDNNFKYVRYASFHINLILFYISFYAYFNCTSNLCHYEMYFPGGPVTMV